MKRFHIIGSMICLLPLTQAYAQDDPIPPPDFALTQQKPPTGPTLLKFNGENLDGFYTYLRDSKHDDPKQVFTVRDGLLEISGEEWGGITTEKHFENYLLTVEWRWGEKVWPPREAAARDSGILLHGIGEDGAAFGQWLESIECQIIEGGCGDLLLVGGAGKPSLTVPCRIGEHDQQPYYDPTGTPITRDSGRFNWWGRDPAWTDTLGVRGVRDVEKPVGEWNQIDVYCQADRIAVLVNGVLVNVGTNANPRRGKIQFQSEGAQIQFRRIEIRPILEN